MEQGSSTWPMPERAISTPRQPQVIHPSGFTREKFSGNQRSRSIGRQTLQAYLYPSKRK
jgi:hypothetical protein